MVQSMNKGKVLVVQDISKMSKVKKQSTVFINSTKTHWHQDSEESFNRHRGVATLGNW